MTECTGPLTVTSRRPENTIIGAFSFPLKKRTAEAAPENGTILHRPLGRDGYEFLSECLLCRGEQPTNTEFLKQTNKQANTFPQLLDCLGLNLTIVPEKGIVPPSSNVLGITLLNEKNLCFNHSASHVILATLLLHSCDSWKFVVKILQHSEITFF